MSESEPTEVADQETKLENSPKKRVRHRKKQLYENILKQMEFYFSDANISKDRFLGDLVKSDPFVPLEVFLKFNKIRSLTQDVIDIAKAMKNSTFLELSEDRTKVQRKTPVMPYDADSRTVYVESIPVTASRNWLERVFSDYGHVAYISLPKFKNSQKIKGFAFIEFTKPEDAQKCINTFTQMGCKLPTCMPPEELSSIKMFSVEEHPDAAESKETKDYEPPKKKKKKDKKAQKSLELKLESESDNEKRVETPSEENKSIASVTTPSEESKISDMESKDEMTSQDETKDNQDATRKKKTRKRTAKERSKAKNDLNKNEAPRGALWGLQVLSKSEWKALRNKYLNLQRKYMKELKATLQNKRHQYSNMEPAAPSVEVESADIAKADNSKAVNTLERIPGVFVREELSEPCLDVRLTKRTIRTNIHALHVDVKEGQSEAFVRFDSAKAAEEYCANSSNPARVLSGPEEQEQWTRAESAMCAKRVRGRARVLQSASNRTLQATNRAPLAPASPQPTHTHIRFEDE